MCRRFASYLPPGALRAIFHKYLEGWDPKEIDELPLKIALGRIANRRNAARTRIAKRDR